MSRNLILITIALFGFIALSSATTCGQGPWWTDINSKLVANWISNDRDANEFKTLQAAYDLLEPTTVTATHAVTKGHCASYFTVGTDKSCCTEETHKKLINKAIKASIRSVVPPGKTDRCRALKDSLNNAARSCFPPKSSAAPSGSPPSGSPPSGSPPSGSMNSGTKPSGTPPSGTPPSGTPPSGTPPSGTPPSGTPPSGTPPSGTPPSGTPPSGGSPFSSVPSSVLSQLASLLSSKSGPSGSGPSGSGPSGSPPSNKPLADLQDKVAKAENFMQAKGMEFLGQAAKDLADYLRGVLCVVCLDPDAKSTLFESSTWIVNTGTYNDLISKFVTNLNNTAQNGRNCTEDAQYNNDKMKRNNGTCAAVDQVIADFNNQLYVNSTKDDLTNQVKNNVDALPIGLLDLLAGSPTVGSTTRRQMAATTTKTSETGGAKSYNDPVENGDLEVGGQTTADITSAAASAQTDYNAAGGVDYQAVADAEKAASSSNIISILILAVLTIAAYVI